MPLWAYLVIGFLILALVLLTFRRNQVEYRERPVDYGGDFRSVLDAVEPALQELNEALREGSPGPLSRAAAAARSKIHTGIANLDRLGVPDTLSQADAELIERLRDRLRQALENYEWAARIAETTDLLENAGLRRGYDSLVGAGDQLFMESRFELVELTPPA